MNASAPALRSPLNLIFLLVGLSCLGCDSLIPPRPPIGDPKEQEGQQASVPGYVAPRSVGRFQGPWKTWYLHRLGSQIVGVTSLQADDPLRIEGDSSEALVEFRRDETLRFRSGKTQFIRQTVARSTESPTGEVQKFDLKVRSGPIDASAFGGRTRDRINITWAGAIRREPKSIVWPENAAGLFALEQTLRREPIKRGETRRIESLMPSLANFGWIELKCLGQASVAMLNGDYRTLLEIEAVWYESAQPTDALILWSTENGEIQKTLQPATRIESFAVSESVAERSFKPTSPQAVFVDVESVATEDAESVELAERD
ncbi:MAG: hypothetical protein AAGJ83_04605, partial [Planctomycetota bacterium]